MPDEKVYLLWADDTYDLSRSLLGVFASKEAAEAAGLSLPKQQWQWWHTETTDVHGIDGTSDEVET